MSGKKTAKVLELKAVRPDPDPDVVAMARDFLARAESGDTQCVVLVMDCNGGFIRGYAGKTRKYEMLGAARMLEQQIIDDLKESTEVGPPMREP